MVVICMATVLFLMVEWHIGGCGLHISGCGMATVLFLMVEWHIGGCVSNGRVC